MSVENGGGSAVRPKGRSPSYPAIDLQTAIERARLFYEKEGRNTAPVQAILKNWGYSPGSGPGNLTLAAVKKFGLLEDEGKGEQRQARLTDLALEIVLDDRADSPDRARAIREAALRPTIHAELWQRYDGSLPSDENLRWYLRKERAFTDSAANSLIKEFRRTVSFAGLTESDQVEPGEVEPDDDASPNRTEQAGHSLPSRHVQIPLPNGDWATLSAPFPIGEDAWEQLLRVLEAMKPGLVSTGGGQVA